MTHDGWTFDPANDVDGRHVARIDGGPATWREVIAGLQHSDSCRIALTATLAGRPERQVFWETPPLTVPVLDVPAEFMVSPAGLSRPADPSPFEEFIAEATEPVVTFTNLGRDATLVVPTDLEDGTDHSYLLSFLRTAGDRQRHAFWRAVGEAMAIRVSYRPVWVSTSGGGVSWLHVRLDDRPKYYVHGPYRQA